MPAAVAATPSAEAHRLAQLLEQLQLKGQGPLRCARDPALQFDELGGL